MQKLVADMVAELYELDARIKTFAREFATLSRSDDTAKLFDRGIIIPKGRPRLDGWLREERPVAPA